MDFVKNVFAGKEKRKKVKIIIANENQL